jgi:hypothetical protein
MRRSRRGILKPAVTPVATAATPVHDRGRGEDHGDAQPAVPSDPTVGVKSLESLPVKERLVDRKVLDSLIDTYQPKIGPRNGARVACGKP